MNAVPWRAALRSIIPRLNHSEPPVTGRFCFYMRRLSRRLRPSKKSRWDFSAETSYDIAKRCFASQHNSHGVQIVPLRARLRKRSVALRKPSAARCRLHTCADRRVFCLGKPEAKKLFQSPHTRAKLIFSTSCGAFRGAFFILWDKGYIKIMQKFAVSVHLQ